MSHTATFPNTDPRQGASVARVSPQTRADEALAWWCEFDFARLAAHLAALREAGLALPLRLGFLDEVLGGHLDQAGYGAWFERFQCEQDVDAAAVTVAAALADIWQSGDDLRRLSPWLSRCRQLQAAMPTPAALPRAAMLGYAAATEMVSGAGIAPARASFAACREAADAARSLPLRLFQATFETYALLWSGEFASAEVLLNDASDLACRPGTPYLAGLFLRSSLCLFLTLRGDPIAARHLLLDDARQPGFDSLPPIPWLTALSNLVYAAALEGDEIAVEALGARMRKRLVPAGNAFYHAYLHMSLGLADLLLGRPATALAHARESRALGQPTFSPVAQYMPVLLEVQARVDMGDYDGALALADAWLPKWQAVGHMSVAGNAAVEMAVAHARQGQPDRARAALDHARRLLPHGESLVLFHRPADYLAQLLALLLPAGKAADLPCERYPVAIHTLGELRVRVGARLLYDRDWRGERAKSLLKALVVLGGRKVPAEKLANLLWPDADGDQARNNLKVAAWRLRQLGTERGETALPWLLMHNGQLSLASGVVGVDALIFQESAKTALRGRPPDAPALLRALDLYEDDFLAGDESQLWISDHRQRLRETFLSLARALGAQAATREELEQAVAYLERGHAIDPLDERTAEGLMVCYLKLGYPGRALLFFRETEAALMRELGITPGSGLTALSERARRP
ncbi:MAG: BTAD domain-containing putative transcriptional regulator [Gallionellaceae bacterium]|nr:BTAD domain-containing putative transcriptional regulator [Gallionellaceae bacterium]